ncbi:predicted protein [Naegleria gruberi]|uniref:Predicted protein n=1 Tax=Naegleria gruberi TaxID=5762 RepID=D2V4Z6_NAEGR|nr:uncharacterized protein NAEGRDRAFT_78613 [Naegleria gruberi]EFC48018.1 predicted protein [Naegleria gruberi]|eukprot:XP_002680762.1 predicted protein [Naegleria gruberi strain NEG-M]
MSLADQLLEKTKQQKLRSASAFAPNFKKPNIGGGAASSTPSKSNNTNNNNNNNNNNTTGQTEAHNEASAIGSGSALLSVPPTLSLSFNPTQDNPLDQSLLSTTSSTSIIQERGTTSNSTIVGGDDNNNNAITAPSSSDDNNTKKDKRKTKTSSREKKRRRKIIYSDDEDDEYVEPPQDDNEEDAISTTSAMTATSSKSATSSKTKRLKKPTGDFKTISDFIRDAILNDYESENTNINNNNNRSNMNNNSSAQQNGISADEFINEEDEFEIENDDQYKDRVHQIEMEDDEKDDENVNSDNISAVSGKSSYKNFVEVKAPSIIPPNPYKPADNNSEFDDDYEQDLDSEFGDLEKPAGGPSVFSFDSDGNILMKPTETDEALIPFMESGRQEFNYSRAMRLANLDTNKPVTQATYARKGKGERWTKDDLELFYDGLRQFGTDFSMISRLFPKRTRREIHQKYKNEEKKNKKKIEFALKNRAPIDMTLFQKKSKEKDKIQGITRKKVTKTTSEGASNSENNEDEWKEVTSSSKTTSSYEQAIDDEFEEDEFDIDDYDPEEDEKKYERPVSKPQSSTASSATNANNNQDEFEEVEGNEEDETFDNFGNNVLGRGEDEFE